MKTYFYIMDFPQAIFRCATEKNHHAPEIKGLINTAV